MWPARYIFLTIVLVVRGEDYKFCSSSLCNPLPHYFVYFRAHYDPKHHKEIKFEYSSYCNLMKLPVYKCSVHQCFCIRRGCGAELVTDTLRPLRKAFHILAYLFLLTGLDHIPHLLQQRRDMPALATGLLECNL